MSELEDKYSRFYRDHNIDIESIETAAFNGGGGGTNDHGALTGLSDDDHSQYLNNARGDIRYYTKSQIDSTVSGINSTVSALSEDVETIQEDFRTSAFVSAYNESRRYGCLAMTMLPHDLSDADPKTIALQANRLYAYWLPVPSGITITGVKFPLQAVPTGSGQLHFQVYQQDLSRLGTTGNVAGPVSAGSNFTWFSMPLTSPSVVSGNGIWVTLFSSMDTGPNMLFSDTNVEGWIYNPGDRKTALRIDDTTLPTTTLNLAGSIDYLDILIGVY